MKSKIYEIEQLRKRCGHLDINKDERGRLILQNRPTYKKCGLYWLYTSYSLDELCTSIKSNTEGAVDIPFLANSRKNLNNVIKPSDEDFWVVYNGIGGGKEGSKHSYDLGGRILQEFRDNEKTGSLKLLGTTLNDLTKWKYSYVELDFDEYKNHKKDFETGWRLEYCWPILSKQ